MPLAGGCGTAPRVAGPSGLSLTPRAARADFEVVVGAIRVDVVGTRYYTYDPPLLADAVVLEREPSNRYDPLAVKVVNATRRQQLGHLPRGVAAALAPLLDARFVHIAACLTAATPSRIAVFIHIATLQRHVDAGVVRGFAGCAGFEPATPLFGSGS